MEIYLRKFELFDTEKIFNFMQNRELKQWLGKLPEPYTIDDARIFIKESNKKFGYGSYNFAIAEKENDDLVGAVSIKSIDKEINFGEIGYWVGSPFWNMGIASKALFLLSIFGKKELGLKGFFAFVVQNNLSSIKTLEKNGFKKDEGFFGSLKEQHGEEKILRFVKIFEK